MEVSNSNANKKERGQIIIINRYVNVDDEKITIRYEINKEGKSGVRASDGRSNRSEKLILRETYDYSFDETVKTKKHTEEDI